MGKMNFQLLVAVFVSSLTLSCSQKKNVSFSEIQIPYFGTKKVQLDTFLIDSLINADFIFSGNGLWTIFDKQLVLAENKTGELHVFSDDLNLIATHLGIGDGPNKLSGSIMGIAGFGDGLFILGGSYDYYLVDRNWQISIRERLDFYHEETPFEELESNPQPNQPAIYEVHYEYLQPKEGFKGNIVLQISSSHPKFNYLWNAEYYQTARILGKVNPAEGKVYVQGAYSPSYYINRFIPYLIGTPVAYIDEKTYIQGYEADSLLYQVTSNGEVSYAFGMAGKDMNIGYPSINALDFSEYDQARKDLRTKYDYYTTLDYIPELDFIVRGYTKRSENSDGIQVYKNDSLMVDQSVPKGFKFFGYKSPYIYGSNKKQAEFEDRLVIYRIKVQP